jgi:formate-dependent nitrite reductase membrane component NrfD
MVLMHWFPGNPLETAFKVMAGITALGVATYSGFVVSYVSSVKFWHSAVMPVLFIVSGLAGGAAIILVINSITGFTQFDAVKHFAAFSLTVYAAIIGFHLWISTYNSATARRSVMTIISGNLAIIFWLVIVFIGIAVPLLLITLISSPPLVLLFFNAACILSGNLALRYVVLKAGRYSSLLPE